jgi:tetratricopeptide (TPR) repeat protein
MSRARIAITRRSAAAACVLAFPLATTLLLSGCAVVGRGGRDPASPVATPADAAAGRSETDRAERKREAREAKRAAAEAKRAGREAERTAEREAREAKRAAKERRAALDPLGEARLRAGEEPAEPWWPYRAAVLEAEAGRVTASESSLRDALARDPSYAPALARLSRILYEQGRHAEALELLAPVRRDPAALEPGERAAVLAGLALHEAALGRDADARGTMGTLEGGDRDGALGVAAYLAVRSTSADSALRLTKAAVRAAPGSAAQQNNLGIALLRSGDVEAAEKAFARAIELDPARPGPYYNLAILERFYRLDTGAAARRFQEYWSRSHADPDSLYAELGRAKPAPVAEGSDAK